MNITQTCVLVLWIAFVLCGQGYILWGKNVEARRRFIPKFNVCAAALFTIVIFLMSRNLRVMVFALPTIAFITWLNMRLTQVCSNCGKAVLNGMHFRRADYCPKCGESLRSNL